MVLVDIENSQVARDIGDPWGRTPHLCAILGHRGAILYVPLDNGSWAAKRVRGLHDAIVSVEAIG